MADTQRRIVQQQTEVLDALRDLNRWTDNMKGGKAKKSKKKTPEVESLPPVRGSAGVAVTTATTTTQAKVESSRQKVSTSAPSHKQRENSFRTRGAEYYREWDKFDLDAALAEVDSGEAPTPSTAPITTPGQVGGGKGKARIGNDPDGKISQAKREKTREESALQEKEAGNTHFKKQQYPQAITSYSKAIALDQDNHILYANRALAQLKLNKYSEAEQDCDKALSINDKYAKAYHRRGMARRGLGDLKRAVQDFETVLVLEPKSPQAVRELEATKVLIAKQERQKKGFKKMTIVDSDSEEEEAEGEGRRDAAQNQSGPKKPAAAVQVEDNRPRRAIKVNMVEKGDSSPLLSKLAAVKLENERVKKKGSKAQTTTTTTSSSSSSSIPTNASAQGGSKVLIEEVEPASKPKAQPEVDKKAESGELTPTPTMTATPTASPSPTATATAAATAATAPKTSYEIEQLWRSTKGDPVKFAPHILAIEPTSYPQVFKESLESDILVGIGRSMLHAFFPQHAARARDSLQSWVHIPRFDMAIMFMSGDDKAVIRNVCDAIDKELGSGTCAQLRPKFDL